MAAGVLSAAVILFQAAAFAQETEPPPGLRLNQTPDCLVVENVHSSEGQVRSIGILDTRLHLYIYVPRETTQFTLGIYDQDDDTPAAQLSEFELYAPDGSRDRVLGAPRDAAWSEYSIVTGGRWGVWRLSVSGPQDLPREQGAKHEKARNYFVVRTLGEVDLYLKPEAVMRVRGVRFSPPCFGGAARHDFTVQRHSGESARFNFLWPQSMAARPQLQAPAGSTPVPAKWSELDGKDDRLAGDLTLGFLETTMPAPFARLEKLSVPNVSGIYGLGSEQGLRLFFHAAPLMPLPTRVPHRIESARGSGQAARIEITSPQTANESYREYSSGAGEGALHLLPGIDYRAAVSHGFESVAKTLNVNASNNNLSVVLPENLAIPAGWYSGDSHIHTCMYDGTHTPGQCVEAVRAAGLDWVIFTEHGHSENIARVERVNAEATTLSEAGTFIVLPGMEYTGPTFHANILGGVVRVPEKSTLPEVIAAVQAIDSEANPVTVKLNHPTLGKTAANLARELQRLPLMELWNSREPDGTELWWELLNRGLRTFAETSSDSHHRENLRPGINRTYVFLGDQPLNGANIIRALREGRSFLSRGAFLDFTLNGARSGASMPQGAISIDVSARSTQPIEKIEVVRNGVVVHSVEVNATAFSGEISLPAAPGWYLVRVMKKGETIPLAMSNPIWMEDNNQ